MPPHPLTNYEIQKYFQNNVQLDDEFVLIDSVLKEYNDMKEKTKNLKTSSFN